MIGGLLGEEFWKRRTLRSNLRGVRLEEPGEELEETYREARQEVETFTGREFEEEPDLLVVAEESPRQPLEEGIYFEDSNTVVVNPNHRKEAELSSDSGWEKYDFFVEQLGQQTMKDVLLEESTHALQDQHNGVTNYDHGPLENLRRWTGLDRLEKQPDFVSEGFADYVTGYLGNSSLEFTAAMVHVSAAKADQENQRGRLEKLLSSQPETGLVGLDHSTQRYLGHLYYKTIEEEEGLDAVMETALEDPPGHEDLEQVIQRLEESDVERDEEVYEFSRDYVWSEYG